MSPHLLAASGMRFDKCDSTPIQDYNGDNSKEHLLLVSCHELMQEKMIQCCTEHANFNINMFVGESSYRDVDTPKKRMIKVEVKSGFLLWMLRKTGIPGTLAACSPLEYELAFKEKYRSKIILKYVC